MDWGTSWKWTSRPATSAASAPNPPNRPSCSAFTKPNGISYICAFAHKEGELLAGVIQRIESRGVIVDLGRTEGVLPPDEQVPGERYRIGQHLKVYAVDVTKGSRMPSITLSRTHKSLVKRLFEVEVPEIFSGIVEIRSIAREPGSRSKIAVMARQEGIDPVGACVGLRGARIQTVVNELNGEKIDVILYDEDPAAFVANALSPAEVKLVSIDPLNKRAEVLVPDSMLSLAIGKEGQNARLAAKLTGWRVDIKGEQAAAAERNGHNLDNGGGTADAQIAPSGSEEAKVVLGELQAEKAIP